MSEVNSEDGEPVNPIKTAKKPSITVINTAMIRALQKRPTNHINEYADSDVVTSDVNSNNSPPVIRLNINVGAVTIKTAQKFQVADDPHQYHIELSSSNEDDEEEKKSTGPKGNAKNTNRTEESKHVSKQ